jgi:hypothetical protein
MYEYLKYEPECECECKGHPECCGDIADYCEETYSILKIEEPSAVKLDNFIYQQWERKKYAP